MKVFILLAVFLSANLSFAKGKDCENFSKYKDVSMSEMKNIVKTSKTTIIDVNKYKSKKEFHQKRIGKAINYYDLDRKLAGKLPNDLKTPIVAYCGGKSCTAWRSAAKQACEMGYTNIRHFSEGLKGWGKIKKS